MKKNKSNKKRRIICFIVLDILIIFCILFLYLYYKNIDNDSLSSLIEKYDGQTRITIYSESLYPNKMLFYLYLLVFIAIDSIILTVILIMEYLKNKEIKLRQGLIIIILVNIIITFFLPKMILFTVILTIVIVIVFLVKYLFDKKIN
jgi:hypothetical protein